MSVTVIPWLVGTCSLYALQKNDVILAEEFMLDTEEYAAKDASRLAQFLLRLKDETYIPPSRLRIELPNEKVYAMYNHKPIGREPYNPIRLLCAYPADSNRILVVGGGFYKRHTQPIQDNPTAMVHAKLLANVVQELNRRVERGEINVAGSQLLPRFYDSLKF